MTNYDYSTNNSFLEYSASVAATWVWAPALFVSSSLAASYGIEGLLWFVIPNTLTLILFGYIANRASPVNTNAGDIAFRASIKQGALHTLITQILLFCSSFVQLLGIYYLLSAWFPIPRVWSGLLTLSLAYIFFSGGFKTVIRTDFFKYMIMLLCGITLLFLEPRNQGPIPSYSSIDFITSIGIPTAIGLLTSPYIDSTFWQRAVSIRIQNYSIPKVFNTSAFLFCLIPLIFGLIGLNQGTSWNIQDTSSLTIRILLSIAVFSALISTLDSNLIAYKSITKSNILTLIFSTLVLLFFCLFPQLTITDLFLFYGTARTAACIPTILIIFNKYSPDRLFYSTLTAFLLGTIGFALSKLFFPSYAFIFTLIALLVPIFGYKHK